MNLPLILDLSTFLSTKDNSATVILDLSTDEEYSSGHIPNAIQVHPSLLQRNTGDIPNKLPTQQQLSELFSNIGLSPEQNIIVYDHQQGALAGRMIWTLHIVGHKNASTLNGQFTTWQQANQPTATEATYAVKGTFNANIDQSLIADKAYIEQNIDNPEVQIWDARSAAEYNGEKIVNAKKGGHIPGAKHLEWSDCFDAGSAKLDSQEILKQKIVAAQLALNKETITHCQTHRRSGLTYIAALQAGIANVRCYDGSWFEWGNDPDTPVSQ